MREIESSLSDSLPNIGNKKNSLSKLLIHESPLQVLPSLAVLIGLNEAIILQQMHYWICSSLNKNIIGGRKWVYNSYSEWNKQFPFWSQRTIRVIIASLHEKKLILSGSYNKMSRDRTKWYTIDYDKLHSLDIGNNDNLVDSHVADPATCIYPNLPHACGRSCHMDMADPATCNTIDYLPEITREHIVRNSNFVNEFEEFWKIYDKKSDKKKCEKAYIKLLNDKGVDLHAIIINSLEAQKKARGLAETLGLWQPQRKMALTWLNGNCWEDEVKTQEQLYEERKRAVGNLSNQPKPRSSVDQYHDLNARIRNAAEQELKRLDGELERIEREEANPGGKGKGSACSAGNKNI